MSATVYFMYDEDDEPLYVGATTSIERRLPEHRSKVFWPQVQTIGLVHFDTWDEAYAYEQDAIRELEPPHNVAGTHRMIPIARSAAIKAWKDRKEWEAIENVARVFDAIRAKGITTRRELKAFLGPDVDVEQRELLLDVWDMGEVIEQWFRDNEGVAS